MQQYTIKQNIQIGCFVNNMGRLVGIEPTTA